MHERTLLQFSGGKDSLACLYVAKPHWDRMTVVWVNTGDAFPETIAQMAGIEALVPHFLEIKSDQPAQIVRFGYPSDLVPVWDTPLGRQSDSSRERKVQDPFSCCGTNLWKPMADAVKRLGATTVIRGQRVSEHRKSSVRNGDVIDGVRYVMPVEDWSNEDVFAYLERNNVDVPAHYAYVNSSLDCQHCTAYLNENAGKFQYMKERHPALHAELVGRLDYLIAAAENELQHLKGLAS